MSGGTLPKTGAKMLTVTLPVAGVTVGGPWLYVGVAAALVLAGALLLRIGFRRKLPVGAPSELR